MMMRENRLALELHSRRDDVRVDIVALRPLTKKELAAVAELIGPHFTPSQGKPNSKHTNGMEEDK